MSDTAHPGYPWPRCDFCFANGKHTPAEYDFRTAFGGWAYGCEAHWKWYRATEELGTGNGQRLVHLAKEESK
jgi:hypothetical protein